MAAGRLVCRTLRVTLCPLLAPTLCPPTPCSLAPLLLQNATMAITKQNLLQVRGGEKVLALRGCWAFV